MALQARTEMARAKLQNEQDLAARIQANLFPAELPVLAGYDLAAGIAPPGAAAATTTTRCR